MAANNDTASMALFCDFENIALGVRDAQYEKFDIRPVLERLLAKGSIVVKKAYCDWDRYKTFKAGMHEANFELIEIPHVRQSGKNSADIRMVVDALDLCYTKSHVDTFVIISGDSDFSPLVSKLRENAKKVIGVGVKQSCSDLLVTNCDEFIYYDDLVRDREAQRAPQRREREKRSPEEEAKRREKQEERKRKAVDIVSSTFADLIADRGESERIWASVLKEVVKRRNPGFNESYYGFRTFGNLLEEAANRGLIGFGRDDKGAYVFRAPVRATAVESELLNGSEAMTDEPDAVEMPTSTVNALSGPEMPAEASEAPGEVAETSKGKGKRRNTRNRRRAAEDDSSSASAVMPEAAESVAPVTVMAAEAAVQVDGETSESPMATGEVEAVSSEPPQRRRGRAAGKSAAGSKAKKKKNPEAAETAAVQEVVAEVVVEQAASQEMLAKPPRRTSRARKPKVTEAA